MLRLRLLLAVALLFGSEILLWTNPPGRALTDWLLIIPAYLALSAVLLDFTVRYRVRDLFGLLVLTGLYSLIAALVVNPASTLIDMPRTLFTRIMGAHALLGTAMFALFLALTGGGRGLLWLLLGCALLGFSWGIWIKSWPPEEGYAVVDRVTMLLYGGGMLAVMGVVLYGGNLTPRPPRRPIGEGEAASAEWPSPEAEDLRLSWRGWLLVVILWLGQLALRLAQGHIDMGWLAVIVMLAALCWAMLWFRGQALGETLLDGHMPIEPPPFPAFIGTAILFLLLAIAGYDLPSIQLEALTPLSLIGLAFTAYGLAWLPTVSVYLGFRHYLRQVEALRM
jgi:hypothetical protein